MLFNSLPFLLGFLPAVLLLQWLLPRHRNLTLLGASCFFYLWGEPDRGFYLLCTIVAINFFLGQSIGRARGERLKRNLLFFGIAIDLGILALCKWTGFLPLGVSFFVFQVTSYVIDMRRGTAEPEPAFMRFAVYVMMFPHMIAGPIVRYTEIRERLAEQTTRIKRDRVISGFQKFVCGLAKKVFLADTVAKPVDAIFNLSADQLTTPLAWLGAALFALQIYFDFSGYSDMAIGMVRMLGFEFPENFNRPYLARGFREFWRRWHITLSEWLRDYVFTPLSLSLRNLGKVAVPLAIFVTFGLSGIWHGTGWNFVAWGVFHGAMLALEIAWLGKFLQRRWVGLQLLYFWPALLISEVLFRSPTLAVAGGFLRRMFFAFHFEAGVGPDLSSRFTLAMLIVGSVIAICPDPVWQPVKRYFESAKGPRFLLLIAQVYLLAACIGRLIDVDSLATSQGFIYFRF